MSDREQHLVEHISELRRRIIWVLLVFLATLIAGFIFVEPVIHYLKNDPAAKNIPWNVFSLGDSLRVYLQFSFVLSLVFTLPFAMYQAWRFVKPGLKTEEQRATLIYIPVAFILFIVGVSFAYFFLFPYLVKFVSMLADRLGAQEMYGISQYFGFMFRLVLPVGVTFELPIIVMFLTRIRILTPDFLRKMRRFAYVILVIVAAVITPPDFISNILVAIPLILLYEISIWLSQRVYRKIQAQDAEWNEASE
ncbi:twin-arginine translocase subunit TatC [Numidum massiliense]|uniref:twin-arginine translocase subunit TatC n=1 Tax=Numidum massiliense TaxID=1522315 RepID=UPI0006D54F43|nr:twin-arginine translocase subunit TatC [Numidum massiliense]